MGSIEHDDRSDSSTSASSFDYDAATAARIESDWQSRWIESGAFDAGNPSGALADPALASAPHAYVLDMFPYPSGSGLHVGHPLGYIATDCYARFLRMQGRNVLYTMGFDSFGLPAEQYAIQTGTPPQETTARNIKRYREQLGRIGMSHDQRRSVTTSDASYYRWTQWIFLQAYNSWYDRERGCARPLEELVAKLTSGEIATPGSKNWVTLSIEEQEEILSDYRLAYRKQVPVNWCPGLGTVLSDEEVTAEGLSERGDLPVFRKEMTQWMMRITEYADRLIDDLDQLAWPPSIKTQQRNWIGRSSGAVIRFGLASDDHVIDVFTTRPETLFGATFLAISPNHPKIDQIVARTWPTGIPKQWRGESSTPLDAVQHLVETLGSSRSMADDDVRDAVFAGRFARHPATGGEVPVFVASYVLDGYGLGAVMGVPAHDLRDRRLADHMGIDSPVVLLAEDLVVSSASTSLDLNGLSRTAAKAKTIEWLTNSGSGEAKTVYRLRDWLFSRQRYWGEPIPIVYDSAGIAHAIPSESLPVVLPETSDYEPRTFDPFDRDSQPVAPLSRNEDWVQVRLDIGDGLQDYLRDTNTMPNWAGSSWYELRYLDPDNATRIVDPEIERYWLGSGPEKPLGGTDLYVGGTEHAVLHLLYARFWHKLLHDLGHTSSREPFHRLLNQGMIQAHVYRDARGVVVPAAEVQAESDGNFYFQGRPVTQQLGKMGKSLLNTVAPDGIYDRYGADTLRLYEMSTGPLETSRPWDDRAVVGSYRFLQRVWRNIVDVETGETKPFDETFEDGRFERLCANTVETVGLQFASLRFNTAIAKLITLNNEITKRGRVPRRVIESLVLMLAPLAPHISEELWQKLGHRQSLQRHPFPTWESVPIDNSELVVCVVQVDGKLRARIDVPRTSLDSELSSMALAHDRVRQSIAGRSIHRVITKPPTLVNIVTADR